MLEHLFNPESISVVGASSDPRKIGHAVLENLVLQGYGGRIYPVNPASSEIMGLKCYPSLEAITSHVDLAVITLPAKQSVDLLERCVKKKIPYAVIVAGGFSEAGEEGRVLETRLREIIKGTGTRVIGPNTVGVLFPYTGVNTALTPHDRLFFPEKGEVGFISQSGALGLLVMDSITEYRMGISGFINIGNRADIAETDSLRLFEADPNTKSIVMYLESVSDGEQFFKTVKEVNRKKPVIILKTGRSLESTRAAASHTGAMASNDRVFSGIMRQAGITRAYDETELLDFGKALAYQRPPPGKRVAVITTAGGVGVLTTDLLTSPDNHGRLEMASFNDEETREMRKFVLPFASVANPIDLTADGSTEAYGKILDVLVRSDSVDAIIAYALPQTPKINMDIVGTLKLAASSKPVVAGAIGNRLSKVMLGELEAARIPAFPSVSRTVGAMKVLCEYGEYLRRHRND